MFTGIVQEKGVANVWHDDDNFCLSIQVMPSSDFLFDVKIGDSIAVDGVCLTVNYIDNVNNTCTFKISQETLRMTRIDTYDDHLVNLEKALVYGDFMGGHIMQGHVETTAIFINKTDTNDYWFQLDPNNLYNTRIRHKGSIAINGISLTIAEIKGNTFRVSLIPKTIEKTNIATLRPNDKVHIEFDLLRLNNDNINECTHEDFMRSAIELGNQGRYTTSPNPWVGCVIIHKNKVIGKGYHKKAGTAHAEKIAIDDCLSSSYAHLLSDPETFLYVTLEPCHHTGRTPPCDKLLVNNNIKNICVACIDPDSRVAGEGIAFLRENNINVITGICEKEAKESLEPYIHHRLTKFPHVIIKIAESIDGNIALNSGESKWITLEETRQHSHTTLRLSSDAIAVGLNTIIADNPSLTVRDNDITHTRLRVVFDTNGKLLLNTLITNKYNIFTDGHPTLIFISEHTKHDIELPNNVQVIKLPLDDNNRYLDLSKALSVLGEMGILQLLVEGGAILQSQFLNQKLAQKVYLYTGDIILGGESIKWNRFIDSPKLLKDATHWDLDKIVRFNNNNILRIYNIKY